MAITSIGYDGSVNEAQWAKLIPLGGSAHYGVAGVADWKVTPHATMDRGVNIAVGSGWGQGVLDTSDATVSLQGATVSSGSRYDLIVARRNWSGTGGSTTFQIISGSASKSIPNRNTAPGTIDDQPIALVKFTAGQTAAQEIIDLRCWSRNGGLMARHDLALTYLKLPGAQVMVNGTQWNCELDLNGNTIWSTFSVGKIPILGDLSSISGGSSVANGMFTIYAGSVIRSSDSSGYSRFSWPMPFPSGLLTVILANGDDNAANGCIMTPTGNEGFWGSAGTGNKTEVVYSVRDVGGFMRPNATHRVNYIAIGW